MKEPKNKTKKILIGKEQKIELVASNLNIKEYYGLKTNIAKEQTQVAGGRGESHAYNVLETSDSGVQMEGGDQSGRNLNES